MEHSSGNTKTTRCKSRAWFFTWNNPEPKDKFMLMEHFSKNEINYVFQLEKVNTEHFQGVIRYKNPRAKVDEFLWNIKEIHWERCRSWPKACIYCTKTESRIDGPWTDNKQLKFRKSIRDPLKGKELYTFQRDIIELCETTPDDRHIYWFWESNGCAGKTTVAKHLKIKYGKEMIYCNGTSRDILHVVSKRQEENIDVKIAVFGLSRSQENRCSYKTLEILKDGIGFSGKYESDDFICEPLHVIVLANFPPEKKKTSLDRWIIREIE